MPIRIHTENRVLVVTLASPERGNSFSVSDAEELRASLERHELGQRPRKRSKSRASSNRSAKSDADIVGVLLKAEGRLFCAGGNLDDYAKMKRAYQGHAVNRRISDVLDQVARISLPTVCAVSGDCFGGGVELISAFDRIIAIPEAFFGLWQRRVALSFGWGGGSRIEARIGRSALRMLALEARSFCAAEASSIGLVDEIVPRAALEERAMHWIHSISALPRAPFRALKNFESSREQRIFEDLWWNEEHREILETRLKRK